MIVLPYAEENMMIC